jgi:hypothetical protein
MRWRRGVRSTNRRRNHEEGSLHGPQDPAVIVPYVMCAGDVTSLFSESNCPKAFRCQSGRSFGDAVSGASVRFGISTLKCKGSKGTNLGGLDCDVMNQSSLSSKRERK